MGRQVSESMMDVNEVNAERARIIFNHGNSMESA